MSSSARETGAHGLESVRTAQHAHRAGVAGADLGARDRGRQPGAAAGGAGGGFVFDPDRGDAADGAAGRARTGRTAVGLAAMALVGTTSVMLVPATWYSAGQPLWAGFGILATLWYAQSYRRSGESRGAGAGWMAAGVAGWFWTIGHVAGPVAAVYLWTDGRRRCRLAAVAPLAATTLAVGLALWPSEAATSTARSASTAATFATAANPFRACLHTCQAIPENLVFANLGLTVQTTTNPGRLADRLLASCLEQPSAGCTACRRRAPGDPRHSFGAAGIGRRGARDRRLPGRMDLSWLHGLSISPHHQPALHRSLVRRDTADRGRSLLAGWWRPASDSRHGNFGAATAKPPT